MHHRSTRLNSRRLYGALHITGLPSAEQSELLALDAKMAFNSIEWRPFFAALSRMGFGPKICALVKLLYQAHMARVHVN